MAKPTKSEYIRWVKGSLNRLLNASLADDGATLLDYRSWLITFQMRHKLAVNAKVDRPTQDALIKANRKHAGYVRWIQNALLISGEGITAASVLGPQLPSATMGLLPAVMPSPEINRAFWIQRT